MKQEEKQFWLDQYCDSQGVYETPEPYNVPTRAEENAADLAHDAMDRAINDVGERADILCPARCKVINEAVSLNAMMRALKTHNLECAVCGEWRKQALTERASLALIALKGAA
jgi:hypothetical protein